MDGSIRSRPRHFRAGPTTRRTYSASSNRWYLPTADRTVQRIRSARFGKPVHTQSARPQVLTTHAALASLRDKFMLTSAFVSRTDVDAGERAPIGVPDHELPEIFPRPHTLWP